MRTAPMLLTLMLIPILTLLSTPLFATSCPNDEEAAAQYRVLKERAGDVTNAEERLYDALAKKLKEVCDLRDQRNNAQRLLNETETQRDRQAQRADGLDEDLSEERLMSDARLRLTTLLERENATLQKRPKTWVVIVWVVGATLVGGGVGYLVGELTPD